MEYPPRILPTTLIPDDTSAAQISGCRNAHVGRHLYQLLAPTVIAPSDDAATHINDHEQFLGLLMAGNPRDLTEAILSGRLIAQFMATTRLHALQHASESPAYQEQIIASTSKADKTLAELALALSTYRVKRVRAGLLSLHGGTDYYGARHAPA